MFSACTIHASGTSVFSSSSLLWRIAVTTRPMHNVKAEQVNLNPQGRITSPWRILLVAVSTECHLKLSNMICRLHSVNMLLWYGFLMYYLYRFENN